jgi:hypothetical protein
MIILSNWLQVPRLWSTATTRTVGIQTALVSGWYYDCGAPVPLLYLFPAPREKCYQAATTPNIFHFA